MGKSNSQMPVRRVLFVCGLLAQFIHTSAFMGALTSASGAQWRKARTLAPPVLSSQSEAVFQQQSETELSLHALELPIMEHASGYQDVLQQRFPGCLLVRWHLSEIDQAKQVVMAEVVVMSTKKGVTNQ